MPIQVIAGPAGGGKSQLVAEELQPGDALIDFTAIYAAISGVQRGPDGRYPERLPNDPLIPIVSAVRGFALSEAVRRELPGFVTTASRDEVPRLERITGTRARIVDPGEDTVLSRLVVTEGSLTSSCADAASRWYPSRRRRGAGQTGSDVLGKAIKPDQEYWVSSSGRRYPIVGGGR